MGVVLQRWCAGQYLLLVPEVVTSRGTTQPEYSAEGLSVQKKSGRLHMPQQGHVPRSHPKHPDQLPQRASVCDIERGVHLQTDRWKRSPAHASSQT